MNWVNVNYLV